MAISYKKLWKVLIDRDMKKKTCVQLQGLAILLWQIGKNENVTTDVLLKICHALNCDIGDIMEIISDNKVE